MSAVLARSGTRLALAGTLLLTHVAAFAASECPPDLRFDEGRKQSIAHFRAGEYAQARDLEDCLLTLARARGERKQEAQSLNNLGVLTKRFGDADGAKTLYEQALAVREAIGDRAGAAESINNIAVLHKNWGNFYQSLALQLRALALRREIGKASEIAQSLDNIALIYRALGDLAEAERYSREALDLLPVATSPLEHARVRGNLAAILIDKGARDEAWANAIESLALAIRLGARSANVEARTLLGTAARLDGRAEAALLLLDSALAMARAVGDPKPIAELGLERIAALRELGRTEDIDAAASAILDDAHSRGARLVERAALWELAQAARARGDWRAAHEHLSAHAELDRELTGALTSRQMADLRASLAAQQQQAELDLLERDNEIQRLQIFRQRILGVVLLVGTLALASSALLLGLRFRWSRRKHDLLASKAAALERAARTDALTGLPNRLHIVECLARAAEGDARCLLLVDLDHFKRINDVHGHAAGDAALVATAQVLADLRGPGVEVARWGGEEFIVVIDGARAAEGRKIAESLCARLRDLDFRFDGVPIRLTASVGVACGRVDQSVDAQLRRADAAMYAAKSEGRDRVATAPDDAFDELAAAAAPGCD